MAKGFTVLVSWILLCIIPVTYSYEGRFYTLVTPSDKGAYANTLPKCTVSYNICYYIY